MAVKIADMEEKGFSKCERFLTQKGTRLICLGKVASMIEGTLMCTRVKFWNVEEKMEVEMESKSAMKWLADGQIKQGWNQ